MTVPPTETRPARGDQGFSLVETMVALCLLLVVTAGVLPLGIVAMKMTENYGNLMARTTEYAQDKLEQLMALSYGDAITDTRVFPAANNGGTGLAPGGSLNPEAPVDQYVDYLTIDGALLASVDGTPPDDWYYQRLWLVEELGNADASCPVSVSAAQRCLKRITVLAIVRRPAQGGSGIVPRSSVVALKTHPF